MNISLEIHVPMKPSTNRSDYKQTFLRMYSYPHLTYPLFLSYYPFDIYLQCAQHYPHAPHETGVGVAEFEGRGVEEMRVRDDFG